MWSNFRSFPPVLLGHLPCNLSELDIYSIKGNQVIDMLLYVHKYHIRVLLVAVKAAIINRTLTVTLEGVLFWLNPSNYYVLAKTLVIE